MPRGRQSRPKSGGRNECSDLPNAASEEWPRGNVWRYAWLTVPPSGGAQAGRARGGTGRALVIASRTAVRERGERLAKPERLANRDSGGCTALWSDSTWIGRGDSILTPRVGPKKQGRHNDPDWPCGSGRALQERRSPLRRPRSSSRRLCRRCLTSVQLQSTNAQAPLKTGQYQTPESKTIQQHTEPSEICKTSTPGSNPLASTNFPRSP